MSLKWFRRARELDVLSGYAEWSRNYPPYAHNALMRAEEKTMLDLMPDVRGLTALDLACGSGRYARILAERGAAPVIGIDLSAEMLSHAQKQIGFLARADMLALPFVDSFFDVAVCGLALGHVRDLGCAMACAARALKPRGVLVYSDFHPLGYLAGWRREFNGRDGRRYSIEHYAHLYADHDAACRAAGLKIAAVREPIIGRDITEKFPGSAQIYEKWTGWPAVLVIRAEKT
jgi:malonyl-CoA O-methyltransferase